MITLPTGILGDCRDHPHIAITTALTDDTMPQKDKSVIDMGDSGLVHVQPQFQAVFEHAPAFFPDGFRLCFTAFDDEDKVIRIPAVGYGRFPLPVFSDRRTSTSLDAVIPVPAVLPGFSAQVVFMQVLIELVEHDVRQ